VYMRRSIDLDRTVTDVVSRRVGFEATVRRP